MAATIRQLEVIDDLVAKLDLTPALRDEVYRVAKAPAARPSVEVRELISGMIARVRGRQAEERAAHDALTDALPLARPAQAEPGYYVRRDGVAIVVVQNRPKTRTYGKRYVPPAGPGKRPHWEYERGLGISVAELTPMTAADAAALGLSHGHCIKCCAPLGGASLSAAVSAKIGYGETCARGMGWPYPKGQAAQQLFLEGYVDL